MYLTDDLPLFAMSVLVLNATPGVDFLLTVTRTLQGGPRAGAAAALGISLGCVVHALLAAFGLAALLAANPQAFRLVQWAGAAYLAWLGCGQLWQLRRRSTGASAQAAPGVAGAAVRPAWMDLRAGLLTNVLNPKVAFFFLAFLPQFVPAGSPDKTLSFLLLGAWLVAQGLGFLMLLVLFSARVARLPGWKASNVVRRALTGLVGLFFIGLALRLLRDQPLVS